MERAGKRGRLFRSGPSLRTARCGLRVVGNDGAVEHLAPSSRDAEPRHSPGRRCDEFRQLERPFPARSLTVEGGKLSYLYVAGEGRSGSTILGQILNQLPDFTFVGEVR